MARERSDSRPLDWAERWIRDGLDLSRPPAFFVTVEADMTRACEWLNQMRGPGQRVTYGALLVRAAAVALARNSDLHALVCGGRRHAPGRVDIAISVASEGFFSPVMVLDGANEKGVAELTAEIARRADDVRREGERTLATLRRWGWLLPFGAWRRAALRLMARSFEFRRRAGGTFQVSVLPHVDQFLTPVFGGSAVLTAGRVKERVVSEDGEAVVRTTVYLTCSADHRVWDGRAAERFVMAVKSILETGELHSEAAVDA